MKNGINCTGIAVLLHGIGVISCGVHFRPIELSFACDTWLVIVNAFAAFFLSVVHYFAIDSEFTICRGIGFGLVGVLTAIAVVIGSVALSSGAVFATVIEILLWSSVLLPLLWPESSDVLMIECDGFRIVYDGINLGWLFVHFQPVIHEVNFVGVFHHQPCLVLVR
jgi:hypothetical protein